MEFSRPRQSPEDVDGQEGEVINTKHVGNRVEVTVQRPDGSLYEYGLPTTPLDVIFTEQGLIDLREPDENH